MSELSLMFDWLCVFNRSLKVSDCRSCLSEISYLDVQLPLDIESDIIYIIFTY